ncbi:MAG: hypothetical protein J6J24_01180 [Clostridia bacterium]|nr:hypothetical protein [Clostridia bacterium]
MEKIDEELVLLATTIAMQLAKGLTKEEIEQLRNLVNQISCSLSTLTNCRGYKNRNKKS